MVNNLKENIDKDGNVTLTGSIFANPHVVAALAGTKSVTCDTKAIGDELQFTIKLGVTKSIHDVKPVSPTPATVTPGITAKELEQQKSAGAVSQGVTAAPAKPEADVVHPAPKPGTQAPIPATPEKAKTA